MSQLIYSYWFLWAMLLCSIAIWFFDKYLKCNMLIVAIAMTISLFIPNKLNSNLYIFVFPYFLIGYLWQKKSKSVELTIKHIKFILFISILIFGILLAKYNYNSYIYTTQTYLFGSMGWKEHLAIDLFRWTIGFAGSIFIVSLLYWSQNKLHTLIREFFIFLGRNTLGIYILSNLFNVYLYKVAYNAIENIPFSNEVLWCMETVFVIFLCLSICYMIKKIKPLNVLLLGGR